MKINDREPVSIVLKKMCIIKIDRLHLFHQMHGELGHNETASVRLNVSRKFADSADSAGAHGAQIGADRAAEAVAHVAVTAGKRSWCVQSRGGAR